MRQSRSVFDPPTVARQASEVDFCLIAGDVADDGLPAQYTAVTDALAGLAMKWHVVPGNHDYAGEGEADGPADRAAYDAAFPRQLNFAFAHKGWQFVALDSTDGRKWKDVAVGAAALAWLDAHLATVDRATPTVLFTHFPLSPTAPLHATNAADVLQRFEGHTLVATFRALHPHS